MADSGNRTPKPSTPAVETETKGDTVKEETLADVLGGVVTFVLNDRRQMQLGKFQIADWYRRNAELAPDRKAFAQQFKETLNTLKLIGESISSDAVVVAMNDL